MDPPKKKKGPKGPNPLSVKKKKVVPPAKGGAKKSKDLSASVGLGKRKREGEIVSGEGRAGDEEEKGDGSKRETLKVDIVGADQVGAEGPSAGGRKKKRRRKGKGGATAEASGGAGDGGESEGGGSGDDE